MSDYTLHVKKFMSNPLLQRKQFHIEVLHPAMGTIAKTSIREYLAKAYKISDPNRIIVHSFTTAFGGGRSNGFGCIYDTTAAAKKFEHRHRLVGAESPSPTRRAKKDLRTRRKKVRGTDKTKLGKDRK